MRKIISNKRGSAGILVFGVIIGFMATAAFMTETKSIKPVCWHKTSYGESVMCRTEKCDKLATESERVACYKAETDRPAAVLPKPVPACPARPHFGQAQVAYDEMVSTGKCWR